MAQTSRARVREGRGADGGGAARARGSCATAPRFNNCVEGPRLPLWGRFLARACEAEPSDALRQQTDLRSERPAGAACWPPSPIPF